MSFFLNEEQEVALSEFLNRENLKICQKQVLEDSIPKEFRDLIQKTIESGSPVPFFNPLHGYYTVSFTPCEKGNRIYVHHHLTGVSEAIYDPGMVFVTTEDVENESPSEVVSEDPESIETLDFEEINNEQVDPQNKITGIIDKGDGVYLPA